jgi:hypothetical protein
MVDKRWYLPPPIARNLCEETSFAQERGHLVSNMFDKMIGTADSEFGTSNHVVREQPWGGG